MSPHRDPDRKTGEWLNRNILGMGLASLFSDMSHEMTVSVATRNDVWADAQLRLRNKPVFHT